MKTILLIILIIVLALGYAGFVPGVSNVFGSNNPRNLGVEISEEDETVAQNKLGQSIVDPSDDPNQQLIDAGGTPVDARLTQEEFAAHITKLHPISDVQIKLEGNTFEISGRIDKDRIPAFARTIGVDDGKSNQEILDIVNRYIPVSPVFYAKGTGSITSDVPTVEFDKAELGRVPVPSDEASEALEEYISIILNHVPGFSADSITVEDGELVFKGSAAREVPRY